MLTVSHLWTGKEERKENKTCPLDLVVTDLKKRSFNALLLMGTKLKQHNRMGNEKENK